MSRATLALFILILLAADRSDEHLNELARSGTIQQDAPVKASSETRINASAEKIWALLTDVNHWPQWRHGITRTEMAGPLRRGTEFSWTSEPTIRSRIALVTPPEEVVWTGKVYNAKAIHVWKLQSLPGGGTLVKTSESMDGFLLGQFFSSKELERTLRSWLQDLKTAAEQ